MSDQGVGGRIITFYSYKGGTGRSMAVANLAWVMAANRKRVLIMDWDLEAPGLHRYFHPFLADKELVNSRGLVDLLVDYADQAIQPPLDGEGDDWYFPLTNLTPYLLGINFDGFPEGGRIDLLPAGRQGPGYAAKLHAFDWDTFYERLGGGTFLETIKRGLRGDYDYVLIDSRTGVSDTAGICTVQMPDVLVVMFTYNNQSICGAQAVAQSAVEARRSTYGQFSRESFRVFPVASRADPFEVRKLQLRQTYARRLFDPLLAHLSEKDHSAYWSGVEVPNNPFLNYEEVLSPLIFNPDDPKLPLASLLRLASYVTDGSITSYDLPLSPEKRQELLQDYEKADDLLAEVGTTSKTSKVEESSDDTRLRNANSVLAMLNAHQLTLANRLLLRLVRVSRGQEGPGLKRLQAPLQYVPTEEREVMERLIEAGVLQVVISHEVGSASAVELADGDWLARWRPINELAANEKMFLEQRDWILTAWEQWQRAGQPDSLLLASPTALDAKKLLVTHAPLFTDGQSGFIMASNNYRDHVNRFEQRRLRLYVSSVATEFKSYRESLRRNLNLPDVTIQIQEDFISGGIPTLDKLDLYIRECDAVIHLVGDGLGSLAKPRSLAYLNEHYHELVSRFPALVGFLSPEGPSLSYTQWEAWLALLHGRKLLICVPTPEAPREEGFSCDTQQQVLQQEHLARLRAFEVNPEVRFRSIDHLTWQIQSSLFLELRTSAGQIRRPTTLPYAPLGELLKGRDDDLQKLQQQLGPIPENAATPSTAVALIGMGGMGKTRLAIEHAWRNAARHSSVFFAPASTPEALNRSLAGLAAVLDLPEKDANEEAVQSQAVIGWLGAHPGWLLILDAIDDKAAAQAVEALLPQISGGQVLITTRLSKWSAAVQRLPLEMLSTEAAAAFLLERTAGNRREEPGDPAMARELAQDLDGLALALEQAGAYIDERGISFSSYRKDWQERREKVLSWFDPQLMQYPGSVATTWLTSFQQLSAGAQTLLRRLAWLSPEPIPDSLLDVAVPAGNGDIPEPIEAMDALVELASYSLVSRSRQSDSFLLQRLVQEVARQGQQQDPATSQLAPSLRWLDAAFQGDPQDVRAWPVLDPLAAHVKAMAGFADEAGLADPTAWLMNQLGVLLQSKAAYGEAEPLLRRALAIDEAAYGPDHPAVARDLNNLAQLLQATNHLAEAEPLVRRALAINEAAYGPDHPAVARGLNNLAQLLQATNRLAEAEPLMRRVVAIFEISYGNDHPNVATALNNLAQLLQATNRLAEAEPLMRRALAIDEASYGTDHPSVATRLNNLA
ncbi:MAG: hypothetical protein RLZZ206_1069, partial [Cyanobacteriota bacterium]